MALREEIRKTLLAQTPLDNDELRRLLGSIDLALERSRFGVQNARQNETAWELIQLRKKLRSRRADLIAELQERVEYAS